MSGELPGNLAPEPPYDPGPRRVVTGRSASAASAGARGGPPVLEIRDLAIDFPTRRGPARAVRGVSLRVEPGETLGVVGESGSGKSVSALAIMGLLPQAAVVRAGSIRLNGQEILGQPEHLVRGLRGSAAAMVFQDPMTSLNPTMPIGRQIGEAVELHLGRSRAESLREAAALLELVGIPDPGRRIRSYPHELSGGMRQRAMIALAISCRPSLLIADEPTSALDVTIQAQILDLLRRLQGDTGMAILLITHDFGVVAGIADRVSVMYAGRIVEDSPAVAMLSAPRHPYTQGLLRSLPRIDRVDSRLVQIEGVPPDVNVVRPGCSFEPRCRWATDHCRQAIPLLEPVGAGHAAACWVLPDPGAVS